MRLRIVFQAIFDNIATPLPCLCLQQLVELIALQAHMPKVMLTVFKINIGAMLFYRRALKYAVDASSPSKWDDKTAHYEILSLPLHEVDTAASEAAADLAAQVAESSLTISRSPLFSIWAPRAVRFATSLIGIPTSCKSGGWGNPR